MKTYRVHVEAGKANLFICYFYNMLFLCYAWNSLVCVDAKERNPWYKVSCTVLMSKLILYLLMYVCIYIYIHFYKYFEFDGNMVYI